MNNQIISEIIKKNDEQPLDFSLKLETLSFPLKNVKIAKSLTPVTKPSMRGGSYFSEKEVFKITATVENTSIIPKLTNYMLGPNTEFKKLEIQIKNYFDDSTKDLSIFTNLTNTIQRSDSTELNLIIVDNEN